METDLLSQATKVDAQTMAIPQPAPDPISISKDQIVSDIAYIQKTINTLNDSMVDKQALLAKANELGLKTAAELSTP